MPPVSAQSQPVDYRIGPLDVLTIKVFQEPDLEMKEAPVDAGGNIQMALVGRVHADGLTSTELANTIAGRLSERYLVDPQVSVIVMRSVSQRVTVDGQVKKPGAYEMEGRTSLIQAVAMAEGTTEIADTDEVYIFRTIDDKQYGAKFDLKAIRKGEQPDPEIFGKDIVVVGTSSLKGIYQDFLKVAPFLGTIFIATQQN
jgi:polysaccharide export outer membrane protein